MEGYDLGEGGGKGEKKFAFAFRRQKIYNEYCESKLINDYT